MRGFALESAEPAECTKADILRLFVFSNAA